MLPWLTHQSPFHPPLTKGERGGIKDMREFRWTNLGLVAKPGKHLGSNPSTVSRTARRISARTLYVNFYGCETGGIINFRLSVTFVTCNGRRRIMDSLFRLDKLEKRY